MRSRTRLQFTVRSSLTLHGQPVLIDNRLSVVLINYGAAVGRYVLCGIYVSIRRRATTYRLLYSSSSLLPTSRRLRCCSKPTIFDDGPPHTAATKPDGERHGRILHTSTMARSANNEKHERLEQGFWSVTSLLAKSFAELTILLHFHSLAHHRRCPISTPHRQRTSPATS